MQSHIYILICKNIKFIEKVQKETEQGKEKRVKMESKQNTK